MATIIINYNDSDEYDDNAAVAAAVDKDGDDNDDKYGYFLRSNLKELRAFVHTVTRSPKYVKYRTERLKSKATEQIHVTQ